MTPIWQDTFYKITTSENDSLVYSIEMIETLYNEGGSEPTTTITPVFYGRAWAKPKTNEISIKLNEVCRDYLSSELPDLRTIIIPTTYIHSHAVKNFVLYNDNNVVLGRYNFILDWSYDSANYNIRPYVMSRPINGKAVNNMMCFYTTLTDEDIVQTVISPSITGVNDAARADIYRIDENACKAKYALYYLNRYGGWDSFLIEGKGIKKDAYKKYYVDKVYDNTTIDFGKKVYHNEITTSYELHTGWLKDSESENLAFNLLSSNSVYLHDLEENTISPVVITDADVIYKTFRNQNNKLYNYTINVELSQKQHNL